MAIGVANLALERIGAVVDAQAIFSASIDILIAWLEDLGGLTDRVSDAGAGLPLTLITFRI